ncbi:MAG: hypothetical protein LBO20_04010 [Bifidobacteriaceae bacterium]|jgi:hypothetical protein|nr:hypothetical protein [Bifidobacteriaceae bacterium]
METLDRRVQVLFSRSQYAQVQEQAAQRNQSVGAWLRDAAAEKLVGRTGQRAEALARLRASWAEHLEHEPMPPWEEVKDSFRDQRLDQIP